MLRLYRTERRRLTNLSRYQVVAVASEHMAEEYRRHGVPEDRVHVLPLFATDVIPDATPPAPRPQNGRVLFVGRVIPLKGLRLLVDALPLAAAALGRRFTLVVAGDGAALAEARAAVAAGGVPADFLGWIGPERRVAEMRTADVLAVPSLWPEPFGLVGIEAGCVGLPAAGFAVGGITDWLKPGISGESASLDAWNACGLADALIRVLADADHWQRLRIGAWEAAQRFSRQHHLAKLQSILQACAQGVASC
jgi:glycosyltransferase involved in cell wall biosynthesis